MRLGRYIRAFFKAAQLTFKGEAIQPAERRYPALHAWVQQGKQLIDSVFTTADASGLTETKRQAIMLTIDHRPISMDVIISAVKHNLELEYPMLMDAHIEGNITTLYALNMNDQYRIGKLTELEGIRNTSLLPVLETLHQHLSDIPPS